MSDQNSIDEWLKNNNIQPEDLDDLVHDAASSMASNSNNEGLSGQIDFLKIIAGWSDEDIINFIEDNK